MTTVCATWRAPRRPAARRPCWLVLGMAASLLLASCGPSDDASQAGGSGAAPATSTTTTQAKKPQGSPRWETVSTFRGTGPSGDPTFEILPDAIQWRVRWRCDSGALRINAHPAPRHPAPVVDGACPQKGEGFAIATGRIQLNIEASGPWELTIDQQVDTPLDEPLLPGMATGTVVGQGSFYSVEMSGKGTAKLYQLQDGTRVVRLEGFEVPPNTDLFIWLSEAPSPHTSAEASTAPHRELGNVKSTSGNENYVVPADLPTEKVNSVVIWCAPVSIAYAVAPLSRS